MVNNRNYFWCFLSLPRRRLDLDLGVVLALNYWAYGSDQENKQLSEQRARPC